MEATPHIRRIVVEMKRRTKVMIKSAAMMLALSIAFVLGVLQEQPWKIGDKEASGLFYYWYPGIEWTAGRDCWGGPDPLGCFKQDLWNGRGEGFEHEVAFEVMRMRGVDPREHPDRALAFAAARSITFSHVTNSFCWAKMSVTSPDGDIAEKVVDVVFRYLWSREIELRKAKMEQQVGFDTLRICEFKERLKTRYSDGTGTSLTNAIAKYEADIERLRSLKLKDLVWFKAMEIPTNATERVGLMDIMRLRSARRFFEEVL